MNVRPQPTMTDEDEHIADLVHTIREHKGHIEQHQAKIDAAKDELRAILTRRGSNWTDGTGYARIQGEGLRVQYDIEELDRLILQDPLRYGWLKDYRHEVPTGERLLIR